MKKRYQQLCDRPEVRVTINLRRSIGNQIEWMMRTDSRRQPIWFPTDEPGYKVLFRVREDIPIGQAAQEVGRAYEDDWHPANSYRYFTDRDEAMRLVQLLRPYMEVELRTIRANSTTLYQVSGRHHKNPVNQKLSEQNHRRTS